MLRRKPTALTRTGAFADPFALLRYMTPEFERFFEEPGFPAFGWRGATEPPAWYPHLDVIEKENRLIAKVDLPGMKLEDVKVEVIDGRLTIHGERKHETEEKKENFYRSEREYGSFYRAIPLPEGAMFDETKAVFENGVLEVIVPLTPPRVETKGHTVPIEIGTTSKAA